MKIILKAMTKKMGYKLVRSSLLCFFIFGKTMGISLTDFYPYGSGQRDTYLAKNDDGSSPPINIQTSFPYFNQSHRTVYVNTNGDLTFDRSLSIFTPDAFPYGNNNRIIAVYWGDIDTRKGGDIWYRESTSQSLLRRASVEIQAAFPEQSQFHASWIFIATWSDVAFYGANSNGQHKRCTFQSVLVTDGRFAFVMFLYNKIQWTTGTSSGGDADTGLGGTPAQVGFDSGDGTHYYVVPGSRTPGIITIPQTSNIGIPGKYIFRVDLESIQRATTVDECQGRICRNGGTCVDLDGLSRWRCNCIPGYTGTYCETDINECGSNPCQHGGLCLDLINSYQCHCIEGYKGENCDIDIDECNSNPCKHGSTCQDLENGYSCTCAAGYSGQNCQIDVDECQSSPCYNNGTCVDGTPGWDCVCLPGYTGNQCQIDIDECQSNPCLNNGTCVDFINDYTCICRNESTGDHCEKCIDHCSSGPCLHGGICTSFYGGFICNCQESWYGDICEYREINTTQVCTDLEYTECSCFMHQLKRLSETNKMTGGSIGAAIGCLLSITMFCVSVCLRSMLNHSLKINPVKSLENGCVEQILPNSTATSPVGSTDILNKRGKQKNGRTGHHDCFTDHTGFDFAKFYTDKDGNRIIPKCRHFKSKA